MTQERFNELIDQLSSTSSNTLKTKNAKYAPCDDALHNFHVGSQIMGCTVPQCIWGYATKHFTALRDKVVKNDWSDIDDVLEKIQDSQNYLSFLWCAANEEYEKQFILPDETKHTVEPKDNTKNCSTCAYSVLSPDAEICGDCQCVVPGGYINKNYIEDRNCDDCKYWEICDDEDNWSKFEEGCNKEPCKSCKNNQSPNSPKFLTAPMNWEPLNADTYEL